MDFAQTQLNAWWIVLTDLLWLAAVIFFTLGLARSLQVTFRRRYKKQPTRAKRQRN